jgi:hypothetical protein
MKKKVSFDFDDCLDQEEVQLYCEELIERGIEVWVCTARMDNEYGNPNWNDDLWFMCQKLGIPITNTILTNGNHKSLYLTDKDFIWHLDDMYSNIEDLGLRSDCEPILYVKWNNWKEKCNKLLE